MSAVVTLTCQSFFWTGNPPTQTDSRFSKTMSGVLSPLLRMFYVMLRADRSGSARDEHMGATGSDIDEEVRKWKLPRDARAWQLSTMRVPGPAAVHGYSWMQFCLTTSRRGRNYKSEF